MIEFACEVCQCRLSVPQTLEGKQARCPQCRSLVRVPDRVAVPAGVAIEGANSGPVPPATPPPLISITLLHGPGRRFGFHCGYCSSRLEATESMAAQEGQCPTCGNNIVVPLMDRYGRLIDPRTRQIIKPDPHPVHAYAAAGNRAPQIVRQNNGERMIRCPRCFILSAITANNCMACGMPFTMEGTTAQAAGANNGYCVASLVLGVVGLPTMCFFLPSVLAIVFGIIGLVQVKNADQAKGKGLAIAGIICGAAGLLLFIFSFVPGW